MKRRRCKLCGHVRSRHIKHFNVEWGTVSIQCFKCPSHLEDHGFRSKTAKRY